MNCGSACGFAAVWLRSCGSASASGVAAACPMLMGPRRTAHPHEQSRTAPTVKVSPRLCDSMWARS